MKKLSILGLVIASCILIISSIGCGSSGGGDTTTTTTPSTSTTSSTSVSTSSTTSTTISGSWQQVGSASFSNYSVDTTISLAVNNGTPYVAYRLSSIDKVGVFKFNGTNWINLGTEGFVGPGGASKSFAPSLSIYDANNIYVAMSQADASWSRTADFVMKYDDSGDTWEAYGQAYSAGGADDNSLIIDSNGTPYISFVRQNVGIVEVRKYNSSSQLWELMQSNIATGEHTSLQLVNDVPYVGFNNITTDLKGGSVVYWNAVSGLFLPVGDINFTPLGTSESIFGDTLAMDGTTPYFGFCNYWSSPWGQKISVWTFDGSNWTWLGNDYVSGSGNAGSPSLAVYDHTPFMAYAEGGKGYVKYFDGSSWQTLGGTYFDTADIVSLYISNGVPYVAYRDTNSKLSVMKYQ